MMLKICPCPFQATETRKNFDLRADWLERIPAYLYRMSYVRNAITRNLFIHLLGASGTISIELFPGPNYFIPLLSNLLPFLFNVTVVYCFLHVFLPPWGGHLMAMLDCLLPLNYENRSWPCPSLFKHLGYNIIHCGSCCNLFIRQFIFPQGTQGSIF